ncbi:NAD(P)H-dependent oxidoreductase [Kitasatospora sp. NBC_00240]|uniref:NADPH-dependent FMN reductase n=1 Tax=Kitasatospora sp. NBC_00240 TaxID=2903567 RepID=UPI002251D21D|nr:NAD(P)H-dependent oxidoreductase [Kitasatospora sp. NBC_00240]MCX5213746.1 NAD(P)H-dependent oxidoreductase [Kitasatospora sp. NBC_00240]
MTTTNGTAQATGQAIEGADEETTGPKARQPDPADPTGHRLRIAVILGSTRAGRFGPVVADWLLGRAAEHGELETDLVDLVATPLPSAFPAFGAPLPEDVQAQFAAVSPRLEAADGFVIVTPEYNHSFPAPLKNAIDFHTHQWHAKPVGFVSYGGRSGGLRAVEQLRPVLAELHAVTLRETVSFHDYGDKFDADGNVLDPAAEGAAKTMLDQLAWWAHALRDAKRLRPYTA